MPVVVASLSVVFRAFSCPIFMLTRLAWCRSRTADVPPDRQDPRILDGSRKDPQDVIGLIGADLQR